MTATPSPDDALRALRQITSEFSEFCRANGGVSEADTRAKVIDRVLREVCAWPEAAIKREVHVERGFVDYILSVQNRRFIAVEAKREGVPFVLPLPAGHYKTLGLSGTILTQRAIRDAIEQVRTYCSDAGIRYAIATNGYAWILFRAIREDMPWREGTARVFESLDYVEDNFTDFWNILSYPAISAGSLDTEFGSLQRPPRVLLRVTESLFNADLPLQRNRLHAQLHPIIETIFADIADQEQLQILQSCYVHTGSLRIVATDIDAVITDSIPRFLRDEGAEPLQQSATGAGGFGIAISSALQASRGQLFLLLGGIGSGKTTFLKRYQRTVGKDLLEHHTLWFYVDFLTPPSDPTAMEVFVWQSILHQLRSRYVTPHLETRQHIKRAFADNIAALRETALQHLHPDSIEFDAALSPYLASWQQNLSEYVPRLLRQARPRRDLAVVLFIDNVDQLPASYQGQIFILAQRVTRLIGSLTIVALREESYYTAAVQKIFTAYTDRKFHIASPHFPRLIDSRIRFALQYLRDPNSDLSTLTHISLDREAIADFLTIVEQSIFERNRNIARFIEAICFGNMRLALQMFSTFLNSGVTAVDKMLNIYRRDGHYFVAFHEFVKSIMLGDRRFYKESQSPIMNVFDCGSQKNSSHFTSLRLVKLLLAHRGEYSREGQGYVDIGRALEQFEDIFDDREDFLRTANRLLSAQLIEANTRSTETIDGASHFRATSAGWYYTRYLVKSFSYLDLVLQDTPLSDATVEAELRESVRRVDNLGDREEEKLERMRVRFARVQRFLAYLAEEEAQERAHFGLDRVTNPITDSIVRTIEEQFAREKEWIERRLRENREKILEDLTLPKVGDEADEQESEDEGPEKED